MSDASQPLVHPGFLGSPQSRDLSAADAVVLGVPYDLSTSGRAGARMGPSGIRQASSHISWERRRWPWTFALGERLRVIDYGDVAFLPGDGARMIAELERLSREILDAGKTLLSLGGDHFISLPLLRAHAARHGPLSLIHFDAHCDTEKIEGGVVHHGNMFRQAAEEELIAPARSVQIGIRTEYGTEGEDYPFTVLDADRVSERPARETAEAIARVVGDTPAYLSFDIDCLDPAFAPGTGTPVPGGLATGTALQIIRGLSACRIVGMDVVEVAPAYDHAELSSLAAATIALELLYAVASRADARS